MYIKSGMKDMPIFILALVVISVALCIFAVSKKHKKLWSIAGETIITAILCSCYWNVYLVHQHELDDYKKTIDMKTWIKENLKFPYTIINFIINQNDSDNYTFFIFGKANMMAFKLKWI